MQHFKPAWWLYHKHLQTIIPTLCRRELSLPLESRRVRLDDATHIECQLYPSPNPKGQVILLHGMGGSIHSHYIKPLMKRLHDAHYSSIFMHFRGANNVHDSATFYHAANTEDVKQIIATFSHTALPTYAVGFSLGGSVLLKYLGETGDRSGIDGAVAVSVPFELEYTSDYINHGIRKWYQRYLLRGIRRHVTQNPYVPFTAHELKQLKTFWQFDHHVTAKLHGFHDAREYYQRASCKPFLAHITTPTHIVHAKDDPIIPTHVIPTPMELSTQCELHLFKHGGHVGFVSGTNPLNPQYFVEDFVLHKLSQWEQQPRTHSSILSAVF